MVFRNSALLTSWYGSLSYYLQGFSTIPGGAGFLPSTVLLFSVWQKKKALPGPQRNKNWISGFFSVFGVIFSQEWFFWCRGWCRQGDPKKSPLNPNFGELHSCMSFGWMGWNSYIIMVALTPKKDRISCSNGQDHLNMCTPRKCNQTDTSQKWYIYHIPSLR